MVKNQGAKGICVSRDVPAVMSMESILKWQALVLSAETKGDNSNGHLKTLK